MFSRGNRRPSSPEPSKAWECLDTDDVPGTLRQLRQASTALLDQVALVVGRAARTAGFDDLREAASALAARPGKARAPYDYGYACVGRGVSYLAAPALREALRPAPDSPSVLRELVSAYEDEGRHRDAADALLAHEAGLTDRPDRCLLVLNAVLAGDLGLARRQHALLPDPDDGIRLEAPARRRCLGPAVDGPFAVDARTSPTPVSPAGPRATRRRPRHGGGRR
ncbi:hypothetical protein [Streptomyces sp. NPDC059787]|uniref:hypothetical protein n=1 Tax=Streptomyces sp. NPDC059787 TaxID=3346947 RepID=UPI00364D800A